MRMENICGEASGIGVYLFRLVALYFPFVVFGLARYLLICFSIRRGLCQDCLQALRMMGPPVWARRAR
jgi:hypothetical protein